MRIGKSLLAAAAVAALAAGPAFARHLEGYVRCDSNGDGKIDALDLPIAGAVVETSNLAGTYHVSATTNASGFYELRLADAPDSYTAELDPASIPGDATVVVPAGGTLAFVTLADTYTVVGDFLVSSDSCEQAGCWLTGGGTKWDVIAQSYVAERGPRITFGGNVHPGCSPTAGDGGNWNHIDRALKLHFQGREIPEVACGNVEGIPPGSESPVTPVNYIEYRGTGRVQGIQGNKTSYERVHFFARAEDHNEPGSNGAKDGSQIDRYFLHVYLNPADPAGSTVILVDGDGDPSTVDTVPISTGNLQIHVSSCDNPPL